MIAKRILGSALVALLAAGTAGAQDYDCLQGLVPEQFQRETRSPTDVGLSFEGSDAADGAASFKTLIDTGGAESATVVMRAGVVGSNPDGPAPTLFCFSAFDLAEWDGKIASFRVVAGDQTTDDGRKLFSIQPQGGDPLPDGDYYFGVEVALVEGGQIVPDAFDGNNIASSPGPQYVGARFSARFSSASLGDDGSLDVAFTGTNSGSAPTGDLALLWISGEEIQTVSSADGVGAGESRLFEQSFENPGETVRFRVVRRDPESLLYDETTNLPVDAGGSDPDDDDDDDENDDENDPPSLGVDFDIRSIGLISQGEGFYDIAVRVINAGSEDAESTPTVNLSVPNVSVQDGDGELVVVGADGGPLAAGEESAEVRFSLNLGTDPDARPEVVSGQVTVEGVSEDQDPSNNSEGFELEVPDDGSETVEPAPPVIELAEFGVRDEPPTEYGEPGTLRLSYTLRNQGAAGTRYEVDFNADNEGESLVAQLEANGATLDQGEAEVQGAPIPAGPGNTFLSGSLRFVVPEEAWDQAYQGVLVVRAYYENAAGEEIMVEPPRRFEISAELPEYPKPDLKVQVLVGGAQNPEAFTPAVGSDLRFTVRAVNVGRVPVDGELGVKLIGRLLGEAVVEATAEGGLGLGDTAEETSEPVRVDCDQVQRIAETQNAAIIGETWLAVDSPREADVEPSNNIRRVPLGVPENDCGGDDVDPEDPEDPQDPQDPQDPPTLPEACQGDDPPPFCACADQDDATECPQEFRDEFECNGQPCE